MTSVILTLLAIIALLAFAFFKTKAEGKRNRQQFHKDGRRKTFKDFEKERIENDPNGVYGEAILAKFVAQICDEDKRKFVLMKNLFVPSHGGTTEIDSLLLHQSGIYVLESKNVSGEITGSMDEERWHQRMNARIEHTFHNPILQNGGHIRALQHFLKENYARRDLNVDEITVFSVIVFSDRCVLKRIPAKGENWMICHMFQLQEKLGSKISAAKTIFSKDQLEDLYWKLEPCMNVSNKTKAEHKAYVQGKAQN